jgi:excisionase family DNA binding protein
MGRPSEPLANGPKVLGKAGEPYILNGVKTMLNKEMTREIVTVKDLAKYLHCHQSTIYRLVKRGEIPGFRLGGGWRFKIDEIDRWCRRTAVDRGSLRASHAAL